MCSSEGAFSNCWLLHYPVLNVILGALVRNSGSVGKPYMVTFGGIACSGSTPAKTIKDLGSYHSPSRIWHGILSCLWGILLSASLSLKKGSQSLEENRKGHRLSSTGFKGPEPPFPSLWFWWAFCCRGCSGPLLLHQLWQAGAAVAPACGPLTAGFSGSGARAHGLCSCSAQALECTLSSCGVWA